MKAVILAGGKGTRLAPYTTAFPKPLMPIHGIPILEIIVRQLAHFRIKHLVFTVSHQSEPLLSAYFGDGSKFGVNISYSKEEKPLGTAAPLTLIPDLPDTFLVMNGDILTTLNYPKLIAFHEKERGLVTIAMNQKEIKIDFGVMECNPKNRLVGYIEKPSFLYSVSMGVYVFEKKVLKYIPPNRYMDFPQLIQKLLEGKEKVVVYPSKDFWLDIGRPEDYEEANRRFPKMKRKLIYGES